MTRTLLLSAAYAIAATTALGQTPQPFPRPGAPSADAPAPTVPRPPVQAPATPSPPAADSRAPTSAMLGLPIYPSAQFLASYDAGRAQRYYIFGSTASFADLVAYYRSVLKERGDLVFEQPPTHMFEVGRFRQETMAFPPGVTVKDWTWGGTAGYPNPRPGAQPARFPTIIMIVPSPPGPGR
ncbi:MAG: hypothetical protein A3I61_13020 [Acidobacteria bacterium RIFCSPLOWO2_02_FULL_68_18]|nr:MAG: hypothetical protein A3I61_13020 [Acidobacteria bacterium RIFCSPLOWO2_02_FULL_68_18]OFW51872.1 MAG: hypothetical protein A3G77_00665 [Acidobacteria bacterium RIFCSPLOWO2_12_FULL_68_19]